MPIELRFTRHGPVIYQDEATAPCLRPEVGRQRAGRRGLPRRLAVARASNREEFLKALRSLEVARRELGLRRRGRQHRLGRGRADAGSQGLGRPAAGARRRRPVRMARLLAASRSCRRSFNPPQHWLATANHNILPPGLPARDRLRMGRAAPLPADSRAAERRRASSRSRIFRASSTTTRRSRPRHWRGVIAKRASCPPSCSPTPNLLAAGTAICRGMLRPGRCMPSGCRS